MTTLRRAALLIGLLAMGSLLAGCPGMPGLPGAGGEQKMPPGVLPPPGLESGGARTLMGSTITPPDNSFLLVAFDLAGSEPSAAPDWQTCRRVTPLDSCLLLEGLNYDGRAEGAPKDGNQLIPYEQLRRLEWKYEARPAPPAGEGAEGEQPVPQEKKGSE